MVERAACFLRDAVQSRLLVSVCVTLMTVSLTDQCLSRRQGKCRKSTPTNPCEVGCRRRAYYVLSGSVLGMWTHIEGVFMRHYGHNHRMQIVRVRVNDKRLVGKPKINWSII